ncbi:MAG: hypothetical protein J7K87_04055 [Candidatus Aenigmarchaeota archaeon]|nr:hypothetical protein [Candidatus Aenigmarchaeota archaeon]
MAKKIKGKRWYNLVAPHLFKDKVIGEALVTNPDEVLKRTVSRPLPELGGHPSKYYIKVKFKAKELNGDEIKMEYVGHECLRDYIAQMVRKRTRRVDNRVIVETKDKKKLVVKTISITFKKSKTSVKSALQKEVSNLVKEFASKKNFEELLNSIFYDKFQKEMKESLSVIYPLRRFEVRKVEVLQ